MASTLSPSQDNTLNSLVFSSPASNPRYDSYEVEKYTANSESGSIDYDRDADNSSPFMSQVRDDQENNPPRKMRPASRVLSGAELSPLKLLLDRPKPTRSSLGSSEETATLPAFDMPPPATVPRSPRKMSAPDKRFPVKISATVVSPTEETPRPMRTQSLEHTNEPTPQGEHKRQISLEEVVRDNEGLKHAIAIFEDDGSIPDGADPDATALDEGHHDDGLVRVDSNEDFQQHDFDDEGTGIDDTMVSTFSTFSAVPNSFANMRPDSTTTVGRFSALGATPRPGTSNLRDLSPLRTPRPNNGPQPNRTAQYDSGNTTSLMEFTENLRLGAYQPQPTSPSRRAGGRSTSPSRHNPLATPQRQSNNFNLLDFDIPPLPTPRSIPTITPRELESLKSGFLSEISSLKASLSGKEAESQSLKTAVGDAEKRVGECLEQLREAKSSADALAAERESWEKRGREMEAVLRKVKEEIVLGQRDREELEARLDEGEKRRDAAETMAQEAESKMAGMRAGRASAEAAAGSPVRSLGADSNKEVAAAVEQVARELHALYKSKHETKVAALKKSYEARWEKRIRELEGKIDELSRENEELRVGRDVTMTRVDPNAVSRVREEMEEERKVGMEKRAQLEATVEKLEAVVRTVKADNEDMRHLLEKERVEKGELVQLAEEMMNMQSLVAAAPPREYREEVARGTPATAKKVGATPSKMRVPPSPSPGVSDFRGSIGGSMGIARPSGLRAPGGGASRIGKVGGTHGRTQSGISTGVPRPGSGLGMRSGLLSSIEKMGSYRGRAE